MNDFHLINPCQCSSHKILNWKGFVYISHNCTNKKLIMLPLGDLQSLNGYLILRKMFKFKCSCDIFNMMHLLIVSKTIITFFSPDVYYEFTVIIEKLTKTKVSF